MNNIKIFKQAEKDIDKILEYIQKDGKNIAQNVIDRFYKLFQNIAQFPEMGLYPKNEDIIQRGFRMVISDNFLIFYTIHTNEIRIRRILHGASNYKDIL